MDKFSDFLGLERVSFHLACLEPTLVAPFDLVVEI